MSRTHARYVGGVGGKRINLLDGESILKESVSGYRSNRWLWWHGALVLTQKRLIWTPNWFDRMFVGPIVLSLEEVHEVGLYPIQAIDRIIGPAYHWHVQTQESDNIFGFRGRIMKNDNPDGWIQAIDDAKRTLEN